jgi:WD40 repeat protein
MKWRRDLLWIASPENSLVVTYDAENGTCEIKLTPSHPVADVCPSEEGLWLIAGGGKLGRQVILWSLERDEEIRQFNCPDGAAGGLAFQENKLWLTHRHNRKLFCLDPNNGKIRWVIRTEKETFSPAFYKGELWLIECDPGPLGHWSKGERAEYFFIRYDTAREKVVDRLAVPFTPSCMALDGERFWYAEREKNGFSSILRNTLVKQ